MFTDLCRELFLTLFMASETKGLMIQQESSPISSSFHSYNTKEIECTIKTQHLKLYAICSMNSNHNNFTAMRPFAQPGSFHNVFDETTNERESHETSSLQQNPPFPSSCKGSYPSRYTHDQTTKRPRLSSNIAMKTSGGSSDDTSLLSVINSSSDTITEMRSASACEPFPLYQSTSAQDIREKSESLLAFLDLAAADPLLNGDTTTVTNKVPVPLLSLSESSTNKSTNQANSHRKRPIPSKDEMMDELSIDEEDEDESSSRFRGYQEKQWEENFKALVQFHSEHGHCRVPHNFQQNPALARWVSVLLFFHNNMNELIVPHISRILHHSFTGKEATISVQAPARGPQVDTD